MEPRKYEVPDPQLIDKFREKAQAVAAVVTEVETFEKAASYALQLTQKNTKPILAAPDLSAENWELLKYQGETTDVHCVDAGLRGFTNGIGVGLTYCEFGIAETGTIVMNCPDENLRLTTMICDYHVCILKKSQIVENSFSIKDELNTYMKNTPDYTAFITGPSRTADIERVLTIGVHGPLELHILLMED